ncbi:hypothetical protein GIB67_042585, partial [Kingdonia uniflora]
SEYSSCKDLSLELRTLDLICTLIFIRLYLIQYQTHAVTNMLTVTHRPRTQEEHRSSTTDVNRTDQHTPVSHELTVSHLTTHDFYFQENVFEHDVKLRAGSIKGQSS